MEITLKVIKCQVLLRIGTDLVSLTVDKPSPFPKVVSDEPLHMSFEVTANKGVEYCKKVFGLDAEVIDTRPERMKFSR